MSDRTDRSARACVRVRIRRAKRAAAPVPAGRGGDTLPPEAFLEEADRIGQRLLDDSIDVDGHLFWVTLCHVEEDDCASVTE